MSRVTDAPLEAASALVQRVYALLVEARVTRDRLIALEAAGATEVERQVYLGLVAALEDGLRRTLEEALATLKGMKADAAEAWLRRQMEGLEAKYGFWARRPQGGRREKCASSRTGNVGGSTCTVSSTDSSGHRSAKGAAHFVG